jgi:creatinine amidohydrolase/Fe(II)-dependent formamide hydrolase-like protein
MSGVWHLLGVTLLSQMQWWTWWVTMHGSLHGRGGNLHVQTHLAPSHVHLYSWAEPFKQNHGQPRSALGWVGVGVRVGAQMRCT